VVSWPHRAPCRASASLDRVSSRRRCGRSLVPLGPHRSAEGAPALPREGARLCRRVSLHVHAKGANTRCCGSLLAHPRCPPRLRTRRQHRCARPTSQAGPRPGGSWSRGRSRAAPPHDVPGGSTARQARQPPPTPDALAQPRECPCHCGRELTPSPSAASSPAPRARHFAVVSRHRHRVVVAATLEPAHTTVPASAAEGAPTQPHRRGRESSRRRAYLPLAGCGGGIAFSVEEDECGASKVSPAPSGALLPRTPAPL
jgi:hypothetical protein